MPASFMSQVIERGQRFVPTSLWMDESVTSPPQARVYSMCATYIQFLPRLAHGLGVAIPRDAAADRARSHHPDGSEWHWVCGHPAPQHGSGYALLPLNTFFPRTNRRSTDATIAQHIETVQERVRRRSV